MREIRDIHEPFIKWLRERQLDYVYHRPDKRSGINEGHPDFTLVHMRKNVMVECKVPGGTLSQKQIDRIASLRRNGNEVVIAHNVTECIEAAHAILCEGKPYIGPPGGCNYPLEECFLKLKQAVAAVPVNGSECQHEWDASTGGAHPVGTVICIYCGTHKPDPAPVPAAGSEPKFYCAEARHVGTVVVAKDQEGKWAAIRAASPADIINFPMLTEAIS